MPLTRNLIKLVSENESCFKKLLFPFSLVNQDLNANLFIEIVSVKNAIAPPFLSSKSSKKVPLGTVF